MTKPNKHTLFTGHQTEISMSEVTLHGFFLKTLLLVQEDLGWLGSSKTIAVFGPCTEEMVHLDVAIKPCDKVLQQTLTRGTGNVPGPPIFC